jgi:hypothetical protein
MPPTKVETIDELDLRRAAALRQYLRIHAPGNRRRQVFTGLKGKGVTDHSAEYHAEMATLNATALAIGQELQQALQDRQHRNRQLDPKGAREDPPRTHPRTHPRTRQGISTAPVTAVNKTSKYELS